MGRIIHQVAPDTEKIGIRCNYCHQISKPLGVMFHIE